MEITLDSIVALLTLLLGGGGGAFFTWRYQKKKAKAEAQQAETSAAKELQEMYQQMVADAKADREDRRAQNEELRHERDHYKQDRNELRERLRQLGDEVEDLRVRQQRQDRKIDAMRPLMCLREGCLSRIAAAISEDGEVRKLRTRKSAEERKEVRHD